jgi:hypothetical protein
MTANIGSLTSGLDGHMVGIGIGRKGLQKNGETVALDFLYALTFPL